MKRRVSKEQDSLPAQTQNRCIWMTAGVISFKLCPLNYDCECCDFDKVMRSQVKLEKANSRVKRHKSQAVESAKKFPLSSDDSKELLLFFTFIPGEVEERLYLYPTHLWVRQIEGYKWRVGIDKLLAYVLPPPVKVELYDLNKKVIQNQVFGQILTQAGPVSLIAPLSGHLIQTNPKLVQSPELVQQDPYDEGWLVMVEWSQNRPELKESCSGLEGEKFLEEEAQHLKFLLKHRGMEINHIGDTLPDGGMNIKYLHQVLPIQVCLRLANELMVAKEQSW